MKLKNFAIMGLGALALTACVNDNEEFCGTTDGRSMVNFNVTLDDSQMMTKAGGTKLWYVIGEQNENNGFTYDEQKPASSTLISEELTNGNTYKFNFWHSGAGIENPFTNGEIISDLKNEDSFYGSEEFKAQGQTISTTLVRPYAKIVVVSTSKLTGNSTITVDGLGDKFNVTTGEMTKSETPLSANSTLKESTSLGSIIGFANKDEDSVKVEVTFKGATLKKTVAVQQNMITTLTVDSFDGMGGTPTISVSYADWAGSKTDEVKGELSIRDRAELEAFRNAVNTGVDSYKGRTVRLMTNIDLENKVWEPIGNATNKFEGNFDGQGFTISNLNINLTNKVEIADRSNAGFFGYTQNGSVKNLNFNNATVKGRLNVGVVAGCPYTSTYENITVKGTINVEGFAYVGGVFGKNVYANCENIELIAETGSKVYANSFDGTTDYRTYVGGFAGFMGESSSNSLTMTNILIQGLDVVGSTRNIGGFVGIAHYGTNYVDCKTVDVTAKRVKTNGTYDGDSDVAAFSGTWHNATGYKVTLTRCTIDGKPVEINDLGAAYETVNEDKNIGLGQLIINNN